MWLILFKLLLLITSIFGSEYEKINEDEVLDSSLEYDFGRENTRKIDLFGALTPLYLPKLDETKLSEKCYNDIKKIHNAFSGAASLLKNPWAMKLFDSWGKFEDGILMGNSRLMGFFDECLSIEGSPPLSQELVKGQYCYMKYRAENVNEDLRMGQVFIPLNLEFLVNSYATCMPATCTTEELFDSINLVLNASKSSVYDISCQTADEKVDLDSSQIFGICFFSLIILLLIVASLFDLITGRLSSKNIREKFPVLLVFSVPQNFSKIIRLDMNPSPNVISCIHGLRVISILWVLTGHQYAYSINISSNSNAAAKISQNFLFQIIGSGDKSVDTFFTISGFLVAHNVFKGLKKNPHFPVAMYYIHRFIRLTPPIAIVCAFTATLAEFFVHGPFKSSYNHYITQGCRQSWWADVFYLSNFIWRFQQNNPEKIGLAPECVLQGWYTAVDTQLYIILPAILLPLYFKGKKGLAWISFWISASVIIPAVVIGVFDLYPTAMMTTNMEKSLEYSNRVYGMPWCRATPYLVGALAGYILHKYPKGKMKLRPITVVIGWCTMSLMAFAILFGMYPFNQLVILGGNNPADDMSDAVSIIYGSLHRGLWGVWISWIILTCHWGYGGVVNRFLSYPGLQPLSRLTYCIFLTHLGIQIMYLYSVKRPIYYSNFTMFLGASGIFILTIFVSLLLNFMAESPILQLEKIILGKGKSNDAVVKNGIENETYEKEKCEETPTLKSII